MALQQQRRMAHPVKGGHEHERNALHQRQQEAGDEAHIVIERQPADDDVLSLSVDGVAVGGDLVEHGLVREGDPFLQAGGAAGMLQEGDGVIGIGGRQRAAVGSRGRTGQLRSDAIDGAADVACPILGREARRWSARRRTSDSATSSAMLPM